MASGGGTGELFPSAALGRSLARVAVARPMRCEYTYAVPPGLEERVVAGVRVLVPFGRDRLVGVVVGAGAEGDVAGARIKALERVLDDQPVVDATLLGLTRWLATYYACSWGEALAAVLPAALKRDRERRRVCMLRAASGVGAVELRELEERFPKQHRLLRTLIEVGAPVERGDLLRRLALSGSPLRSLERRGWVELEWVLPGEAALGGDDGGRRRPERLSDAQAAAVERITARVAAREYGSFLLRGVTGSGKTEVYLRVIEETLRLGRGAIVLVPEIALTPQTVGWFRSRFGEVAVMHSRLTDAQRLDMWRRVQRGEARVVVGARSAVFAPMPELGVIVVDEEHEPSFKQGSAPRYHARDVAVVRARMSAAACVLGSATPALESWHNARSGRYELLELGERVAGGRLPAVEVVDLRGEKPLHGIFSRILETRLRAALARGEQAILFLNRRGFAPVLWCRECGATVRCGQCDLSMTLHRRIGRLVCHTCCEELAPPKKCPACTAPALRQLGSGSERVESVLRQLVPDARVARMDSDTMLRREDYETTLEAFGRGELDVLVGTQMIAKGLDFPRVTLVGIVAADSALHLPDFRASERTFQLLSQVAGRAGRGALEGHIVVQTSAPQHPAIVHAAKHDYVAFAAIEAPLREELGYPPFGRLIRVVLDDTEAERVHLAAAACAELLRAGLEGTQTRVLGPAPPAMAYLRGRHRQHLLVKSPPRDEGFARARALLLEAAAARARPRMTIDVDPVGML